MGRFQDITEIPSEVLLDILAEIIPQLCKDIQAQDGVPGEDVWDGVPQVTVRLEGAVAVIHLAVTVEGV